MMLQDPMPPAPPVPPPPFDPNLFPPPFVLLIVIAAIAGTVIIFWPLMRALAHRLEGRGSDSALRAELEQLHARVGEVDALHARVAELEERVDFTERLLAQAQPQGRVGAPQEGSSR
jgi:Tfp pilus assembly protein PilO